VETLVRLWNGFAGMASARINLRRDGQRWIVEYKTGGASRRAAEEVFEFGDEAGARAKVAELRGDGEWRDLT
jgi:hypothetical protein